MEITLSIIHFFYTEKIFQLNIFSKVDNSDIFV